MNIEELRARLRALQAERTVLAAQSRDRSQVVATVRQAVEHAHAAFVAQTRVALQVVAAGRSFESPFKGEVLTVGRVQVLEGIVGALGVEAVMDMLLRQIDCVPEGLTHDVRAARLAEIDRDIERIENAEEDLIEASEAAGTPIVRRADARPEIVLRVRP
jgi:hypothetical protein